MMAVVADAVGNTITSGIAAVEIFMPPKSSTATDLLDLLSTRLCKLDDVLGLAPVGSQSTQLCPKHLAPGPLLGPNAASWGHVLRP